MCNLSPGMVRTAWRKISWHLSAVVNNPKAPKGSWVIKFSASESPLDCKLLWHGQSQAGHCQDLREETDTAVAWWVKTEDKHTIQICRMTSESFWEDKHWRKWCWVTLNSPWCHCGRWNPWLCPHWLTHKGVARAPRTPAALPVPDHQEHHSAWEDHSPPETREEFKELL